MHGHLAPPTCSARGRDHKMLALIAAAVLLFTTLATSVTGPLAQAAPAGVHELTQQDVDVWLDGVVPTLLERERLPGATIAVVRDGAVVTVRGFGAADAPRLVPGTTPVDPQRHLFRAGSISKLFTATAVMQQVDRGTLDLDTDIRSYLDFPIDLPKGAVTLRHLLSHTAGFEERIDHLITQDANKVRDLRTELATDPPHQIFVPGSTPAYSNYGNALAGYIVQRVTGVPIEEYLSREIIAPLQMTSSSFAQPLPPQLNERMAASFAGPTGQAEKFEYISIPPAGSLATTSVDMAAFMNLHLGHGPESVLSRQSLELMGQPALPPASLGGLAGGEQMGLGFRLREIGGQPAITHGGDTKFFHSELALFPEADTGIFVSTSGNGRSVDSTMALRNQLVDQFTWRYVAPINGTVKPSPGSGERAAAVAGSYRTERRIASNLGKLAFVMPTTTVLAREDGTLEVHVRGLDREDRYQEVEPWLWQLEGGTATLGARADADGRVDAIAMSAYGADSKVGALQANNVPVIGLAASLLVLLVTLIAWPVNALRRRFRGIALPYAGRDLLIRRLAYAAPAVAIAGLVLMLSSFQPDLSLNVPLTRVGQVLLLVGLLGFIPAGWHLVNTVRRRPGAARVVGATLLTAALASLLIAAVVLRFLWPDLSI